MTIFCNFFTIFFLQDVTFRHPFRTQEKTWTFNKYFIIDHPQKYILSCINSLNKLECKKSYEQPSLWTGPLKKWSRFWYDRTVKKSSKSLSQCQVLFCLMGFFVGGGYNRTVSAALQQPKFFLLWQPSSAGVSELWLPESTRGCRRIKHFFFCWKIFSS